MLFCCLLLLLSPAHSLFAAPLVDTTVGVPTTLNLGTTGNGSIDTQPQGPTYGYGETVELTAIPALGHEFVQWSGDLTSPNDWWAPLWDYRVALNVGANGYERVDKVLETTIDFAALLNSAGAAAAFDPNSLRVVEIDGTAQVIDANVPFQFDDGDGDGAGTLILLLSGTTNVNQGRTYHLYFDVVGNGFTAPTFTDQVTLTDNVGYRGQPSFQVVTSNATYYYHKEGGGFASLVDVDSRDWINYRGNRSGAEGAFRGIPNMIHPEGMFHPGKSGSASTIVSSGPLKETIRTETTDGKWEALWEFFPTYARMTVLKYDHGYWFLYEGTPGGDFDADSDFLVQSDGTQNLLSDNWQADLVGEEWVYFGDPNDNRSLFLAHHEDDSAVDSYQPLDGAMTVFGFGRQNTPKPIASTMTQAPAHFTIGLIDELNYAPAAKKIRDAYKDLVVALGPIQILGQHQRTIPATTAAITLTMTSDRSLTATFRPLTYTLDVQTTGEGTVSVSPEKSTYDHGDIVALTALPTVGWSFDSWSAALGTTSPITLTMDENKSVIANFVREEYALTVNLVGSGTVTKAPDQDDYFYGDDVTLTATANAGWSFGGWSGALSGTASSEQLTIDGAQIVTATFVQEAYGITTTTIGEGAVTYTPQQESYRFGDQVTLTAVPAAGWEFAGWEGAISGITTPFVLSMDGNKTIAARFTQKSYTLSLTQEGQGTVTAAPDASSYQYDDAVLLTALPAAGWRFVGWQGDLTGATNPATVLIKGNLAIHAIFEQIPYTLTVEQLPGGSVTWLPLQTTYFYGDQIEFRATADPDFFFIGWEGALDGDANPAQMTITADATVSAKFTKTPFTIDTATIGSGTITRDPDRANYQSNEQVVLTAEPAAGWRFAGWSGDLSGTTSPATVTVTGNVSATAQFVQDAYAIFLAEESELGSVTITPQKENYAYGEQVTLTATPKIGYRFVRWVLTPDGSRIVSENPLTLTIEDDMVIKPEFAESGESVNYLYLPFIAK